MTTRQGTPFAMLKVPGIPAKPRAKGLTIISDRTIPLGVMRDHLEISSETIDYAKIVDHVGMIVRNPEALIRKKIRLYKKYKISTFPGGIPFELAVLQNKVTGYLEAVKDIGFDAVEVSEDVIEPLDRTTRSKILKRARNLKLDVFTEIGRKNLDAPFVLEDALRQIREDLEAGVKKVTVESSDVLQLKETNPSVLFDLVEKGGIGNLVFEVGVKGWPAVAIWLLDHFGPEVNLENVLMEHVLEIDAMRRGVHRYVGYKFLFEKKGNI
jgi:phosphosulfolactate synthase